jgi:uncharacterized membrane protein YhaH (DUF805 family)
MRALSLLFDPRGAIDRRTFWSGLLQLLLVGVAVAFGLTRVCPNATLAALPVIGEAFAVGAVVNQVYGSSPMDIAVVVTVLLVAARLYVTACLMLKRARHAGKDVGAVAVVGLATLLVHGLLGLWAYDLFDDDMAVVIPLIADAVITAGLGLVVTVWLGASPRSTARNWTSAVTAGQG